MINILMSRSFLSKEWAFDEVSKYLKSDMNVLIVGFSFFGELSKNDYLAMYGKDGEYDLKMREMFDAYGIKDVNWAYYHVDSKDEIIKKINKADVLYFPGGAPDLMMERIIEVGIKEELKAFEGVVIGSSAGAMIQKDLFHISKDREYHKFGLYEGLGYLSDFHFEVHYRRRKAQKSSLRKMWKKTRKPVYGIPDYGIIIVDNGKMKLLGSAVQVYNGKGKISKKK